MDFLTYRQTMSVPDEEGCTVREPVDRAPDVPRRHPAGAQPEATSPSRHLRSVGAFTRTAADAAAGAVRTLCTPSGLRGAALETAWCAVHLAGYPFGLRREHIIEDGTYRQYRTESLSLNQRGLVVSDLAAAGTPILLVHGLMDNRSVFSGFRKALRRRGFGVLHAVNYSAFTTDIRSAAHELRTHVNRLRDRTGSEQVHVVGHSLGGLIARYYVQCLGGDRAVHTLVTLGTPHTGSAAAHLLPTPLARQLIPGSALLTELTAPAPNCRTRFLVVWSRMDHLIVPATNARLEHPDLSVRSLELDDVGHLSLAVDRRTLHWVATSLAHLDDQPALPAIH